MFPQHPLRDFPEETNKAVAEKEIKMIGFHPMMFCDFFQNFEVIQTFRHSEKEYLHGIYFKGKLIGHVYTGDKYTSVQVNKLIEKYMPKDYDLMFEYVKEFPTICYSKCDSSNYAFVYQNILVKVSDN